MGLLRILLKRQGRAIYEDLIEPSLGSLLGLRQRMSVIRIQENGVTVLITNALNQRCHLANSHELALAFRDTNQHGHALLVRRGHNCLQRDESEMLKWPTATLRRSASCKTSCSVLMAAAFEAAF